MRVIDAPRECENVLLLQKKLINRNEHPTAKTIEDNLMKIKEKMMEIWHISHSRGLLEKRVNRREFL